MKGNALKEFIKEWNEENPHLKTSYSRLLEARKLFEEQGTAGLLAKYDNIKRVKSPIKQEYYDFFKEKYLSENRPSASSCWYYTKELAKESGEDISNFLVKVTFLRRLKKEFSEENIYKERNGTTAWKNKYGNYIERDYSDIETSECWVSDHSQLDVCCYYEGKVIFPWVTVWRDFKTSKWLSWDCHAEYPNSDHIFKTFEQAALKYGVPDSIYIDNGKDYKSKDLTARKGFTDKQNRFSGELSKVSLKALTTSLGIRVIYAMPYNPKAKPIERDFGTMHNYFCKHQVGYRGSNVTQRPEKLKSEIKNQKLMSFDELQQKFDTNLHSIAGFDII